MQATAHTNARLPSARRMRGQRCSGGGGRAMAMAKPDSELAQGSMARRASGSSTRSHAVACAGQRGQSRIRTPPVAGTSAARPP